MRNSILTALAWLFSTQLVQAQSFEKLQCTNIMYREAKLTMDPAKYVEIEDHFNDAENLTKLAQNILKKKVHVLGSKLSIPSGALKCANPLLHVLNCGAKETFGLLTLKFVTNDAPLKIPVEVSSFVLRSILAADGPIEIGASPTTVTLNKMEVDAKATLIAYGKRINLQWTPFFYTNLDNQSSFCVRNWFEP